MPINISSQFDLSAQLPLRKYEVVDDLTARNAIPDISRYRGFETYVLSEDLKYRLVEGITNAYWQVSFSGGVGWDDITGTPTTESGYGITDGFTSWDKDYSDLINKPSIPSSLSDIEESYSSINYWTKSGDDVYYNDGNVGIGTTSPDYDLDVEGQFKAGLSTGGRIYAGNGLRSAGRAELAIYTADKTGVSELFFGGGALGADNNIAWTISDRGTTEGRLNIYEGPANTGGGFDAVMTFKDGKVGIQRDPVHTLDVDGTTNSTTILANGEITSSAASLQVNGFMRTGNIYLHEGGTTPTASSGTLSNVGGELNWDGGADFNGNLSASGNITAEGEVTAYSSSDKKLKTNIKSFSASDLIDKMNPVTFNWNDKAKELNENKDDRNNFGLIAQELEEIAPELIHPIYNDYKSIDYIQIIPIIIKALQEINLKDDRIKLLEDRIKLLEEKIN